MRQNPILAPERCDIGSRCNGNEVEIGVGVEDITATFCEGLNQFKRYTASS